MKKYYKYIYPIISVIIGIVVFNSLYGLTILDPRIDSWIMQGYDEPDILQHYAGWCAYRSSDWHFPLGLMDNMGLGTYITFTDSIPLVAIPCKLFLQIIGYSGTFQYFGLFTLLCYILQAHGASLLISRRTDNPVIVVLSMILFSYSPILMERAMRHSALGAQWLILYAMYAYFISKDNEYKKYPKLYIILAALSITIHPYFLPMVMVFSLMTVLSGLHRHKDYKAMLIPFAATFAAVLVAGYCIGAIGSGVSSSREGYGFFSLNLNALFNPSSLGGYTWSGVFPVLPQLDGNYEGFTYLGLGMIVFTIIAVIIAILNRKQPAVHIRSNWLYIVMMLIMIIFAITGKITYNDKTLVDIPLPDKLIELGGIFRSSARMVYPTYYTLFVFVIYTLISLPTAVVETLCVAVLLGLQLFDLQHVITEKRAYMADSLTYENFLLDYELQNRLSDYDVIIAAGYARNISILAGKLDMEIYYSVANSGDYSEGEALNQQAWDELYKGNHDMKKVFNCPEDRVQIVCDINPDLELIQSYGFNFLLPTADSQQDLPNYCCIKTFDENLTGGVDLATNTMTFFYSDKLLATAKSAKTVTSQGTTLNIIEVTHDERFIYITVDQDASVCMFPNAVTIK